MNIITRNTPRLYLRNGDLNLAEGGVAYYSSGIGSITGAYLPALPMEDGGYLVETPVTFMQNILMKRDLTVEGNTLINGDLNINGSFTVNGKEFEAAGYLKDMKDVGYSANGENNKDTASDNDILVYNSTYQSWLYTNGDEFINGVMEDTITSITGAITDLSNRVIALEEALSYRTLYIKKPLLDYDLVDEETGDPIYNKQVMIVLPIYKLGAWLRGRDPLNYGYSYRVEGEVEILDGDGLLKCYIAMYFDVIEDESDTTGYNYWRTILSGVSIYGGNFEWKTLHKYVYETGGLGVLCGDLYALAFLYNAYYPKRVRVRFLCYAGDYRSDYPAMTKVGRNYVSQLYATRIGSLYDLKSSFSLMSGTYTSSFLANLENIHINNGLTVGVDELVVNSSKFTYKNSPVITKTTLDKYSTTELANIYLGDLLQILKDEIQEDYNNKFTDVDQYFITYDNEVDLKIKENFIDLELRVDSWMMPVNNRLINVEGLLGDIELLLDKILGYETNEYLNETLDEIIG